MFRWVFIFLVFVSGGAQLLPAFGVVPTHADSIDNLLKNENNAQEKVRILIKESKASVYSDPARALQLAGKAYDLAAESGLEQEKTAACLSLSLIYYMTSDLDAAMESAQEAKSLSEKLDLPESLAEATDAIGIVYYEIGDKKKSSEYFFESLRLYEKMKDKNGLGQTFCRIGTLYFDQKDYEKALEYYNRSVNLAREIDSKEGISSNLNNVARVYAEKKDYQQALKNYNEALTINNTLGNARLIGSNYLNIAEVYSSMGNYTKALDYIEKARQNFLRQGNQLRIAKCLVSSARIELKTGYTGKGLANAREALQIAESEGYNEVALDAAHLLHEGYLMQNDTSAAYRYFLLASKWQDSLSIGEKQKTLTRLELQYQFEKNEQKEKIKDQRRMVIVSVIILCLVFSIIIIVLILNHLRLKAKKSLLEKENLQQELDFKKKELTLNVMALMKKNEIFSDISEKLMTLAKESESSATKAAIRKIGRELQKGQEDELWKEFTLRFKEVHSDFYNSLLSRFPNLSPNEQKLCAFLRLNMTTKEISELTGQSVSTIEIARHRLRQKLGITQSDVNLITFLSQI
jgi:tetratricopeptide (TPR) repeat protein/DNA-binding CsgD family transcriptional regulator